MQSETRSLSSLDSHERDAWRSLAGRAVEPNPYFDIDFLTTTHQRLRPDVDPQVAMVSSGGQLRAVLPFVERRSAKGVPVIVRSTAAPVGATVADLHIPLLDATCVTESMRALLTELGSSRLGMPVVLDLAVHRLEGPVWEALRTVTSSWRHRLVLRGDQARGAFRLLDETAPDQVCAPDEAPWPVDKSILGHLSRSRRKSLSRALAALEAEYGPLTWAGRTADPSAIKQFARIEDAGWKGDAAQGGQGVLTTAGGGIWLQEITDVLRRSGQLYVGTLRAGDRCVYMSVDMRAGGHWFGMRDVYDETFAAYSPGTLGRLAELAWFTTHEYLIFDSCVNSAVYPQAASLYPDRMRLGRVLVAANGSANLGFGALGLVRRARLPRGGMRAGAPA